MNDFPQPKTFPHGAVLQGGVWTQAISSKNMTEGKPALFLDRDGVVCVEANYLHKVEDVQLMPSVGEVVKLANQKDVPVILVTNQAGIAYGYFGWDEFVNVQTRLLGDIKSAGGVIDGVFACPFHEKGKPPYGGHPSHPARKPNPGMLYLAAELMGVDLSRSWIVGDRAKDIEAGKNAGLKGGVHVLSGHGSNAGERVGALGISDNNFEVKLADDLASARGIIPLLD